LIQELVLILDGRNGVVLAFDLFGASVFGSRRSLPKGFQNNTSAGQWMPRKKGLSALKKKELGTRASMRCGVGTCMKCNMLSWGVERMA
jgi:hypothetical protein